MKKKFLNLYHRKLIYSCSENISSFLDFCSFINISAGNYSFLVHTFIFIVVNSLSFLPSCIE
jgi:hypothetical protein